MGQKKKLRSARFLQDQVDKEIRERISDQVKKTKENSMKEYIDRKKGGADGQKA